MMTRSFRTLAMALLCTAGLTLSPLSTHAAEPDAKAAAPAVKKKSPPDVRVLTNGKEPRVQLRLAPKDGQSERFMLDMSMDMKMSMNGGEMPAQKLPTMRTLMNVVTSDIKPTGDFVRVTTIEKAQTLPTEGVMEQIRESVERAMEQMAGTETRELVSARGEVLESSMKAGKNADAKMAESMMAGANMSEQAAVPVPAEAMGVGAKWAYSLPVENQGMKMTMAIEVELLSVTDNEYTLGMKLVQSADKQKFNPPGMPEGMDTTLEEVKGMGTGKLVMNRSGMPLRAMDMDMDLKMKMSMAAEGAPAMKLDQSVKMKMKMGPAPKDAK